MSSRGQPTPPFNSPYQQQQAIRPSSMLQSNGYPSPARSDSEHSKYPIEGLGLYAYRHTFVTSGPQASSVLYPPSPQPTEAWSHLSSGASPLMAEVTENPWMNYDHPSARSPAPWAQENVSHRSSLSSTREMSIYSREGSELCFPQIKLEGGSEWASEDGSSPSALSHVSLTVSPERLGTGIYPYEHSYEPASMPRFESTVDESYKLQGFEQISCEVQPKSPEASPATTARTRLRRNPTTPENANYTCHKCGKLFQRSYNHKTHLETHNPTRKKEHKCMHRDCEKQFVRRTDLDRHQKSVHLRRKDFKCAKCDAHFARKDTLRRHEEDGCPKRNELSDPSMLARNRSMRMESSPSMSYYPSLRPDVYGYEARSPPLFREPSFPGTPSGY